MKPSWKDAPEWAQWLAMDDDGKWYFYEECPIFSFERREWLNESGARASRAFPVGQEHSLEPRP